MSDYTRFVVSLDVQAWVADPYRVVCHVGFFRGDFIGRWRAFRQIRCDVLHFVRHVIRIAEEPGCDSATAYCGKYSFPVVRAALAAPETRGDRDASVTHAIELEVYQHETGVAPLGTIASLAPFVGLFGTVVGIIKAFCSIAATSGGGTEVVPAGIAEALVTTACGLLVAIPAVEALVLSGP